MTASSYVKQNTTTKQTATIQSQVAPTQFTDGQPYHHEVPEHYSPGSIWKREDEKIPNDKFVYNLISKYAKEGKNESDGKPNGKFYVDRAAAKAVTEPYVKKYLDKSG